MAWILRALVLSFQWRPGYRYSFHSARRTRPDGHDSAAGSAGARLADRAADHGPHGPARRALDPAGDLGAAGRPAHLPGPAGGLRRAEPHRAEPAGARAAGERSARGGGRRWLRAHAARARADRSGAAAGRLVGALGRRAHSRSRNPSVIALISGMPVRAIALMRAFTSAIGRNGFFASSPP